LASVAPAHSVTTRDHHNPISADRERDERACERIMLQCLREAPVSEAER
jgi:hypothetical protein